MDGTAARLRANAAITILLGALLAFDASPAIADYPYSQYRQESLTADGSHVDWTYSNVSCEAAFLQHLGFRCLTGSRISIRVGVQGPADRVDEVTKCQYQDDGTVGPVLESCGFIGYCPYGGTLSGTKCVNPPACPSGQVRDPETGACSAAIPAKNLGCNGKLVGNPCNVGSGTKFQLEPLYRGATAMPLVENAYYNTRFDVAMVSGALGRGWKSHYARGVSILSTGVAVVDRADGRRIYFNPPASGTSYLGDSDVSDRLERLVDGAGHTTGWRFTSALDDSTELFNAAGALQSISDRAGNTLTLGFSDSTTPPSVAPGPGYLISVSDPWGRALHYTRDSLNRITSMTDPAGGAYSFSYDASGNLASITFPDSAVKRFVYNEPAYTSNTAKPYYLTGIIDEKGKRFANFGYGPGGRVILSEHAGGVERFSFSYTAVYSSTAVTDAFGVARTYGLATQYGSVRSTGVSGAACPACGPASQTFDANGNVASRTDWNGNRTNYTYDLSRNLETSRTEALTSAGAPTAQTRTISTEWDANFRLPARVAEPLRITTNVYDSDGSLCGARGALCSRTIQATTDGDGSQAFSATTTGTPRTWIYTYNAHGFVLTVDGPRTDVSDVTTYTYYADDDADVAKRGNVATITDAANHVTSITAYNANGQPLTIVDPNGITTTLTYDARQRLKTRNVGGEITSYDYDGVGQLTKVTLPDGSYLSYTYDDAHRLTGMSDNLGNSIAYTLDAMGNRTHEEVRDPANNLAQTRSGVYNNLNQLYQELGAQSQTTQYAYDNQGNVTSVTDPLNHVTSNQYDALNRLKQVTDPGLGVTQYAYNGQDALTQVTDPRSLATSYTVDGLGNLTAQASPDTGNTANTYDAAGNLLTQTDAKGQVTTYAYDALNRVTLITFHDGSKQTYAYDVGANGIGRLGSITETDPGNNVTSVIAYAYDAHARVTSDTRTVNGVQYAIGYRYDGSGRLDQVTYPSGRTVNYAFDALGRVSSVSTTPPGGSAVSLATGITYHPFGGVKGFTFGNGQTYSRSYDQDGRIATYTLGGTEYGVGYDAASRIEFISETANPPNSNTYGYDALDRLTSAVTPSTSYSYAYDAVGNRTSKTTGASTDTYAYSPTSNRLASITFSTGPVRSFVFDTNGSTTDDGTNTYAYDARGRMVSATTSAGTTTYQVNALGQRVRKTNSSGGTMFVYDRAGHLIAESTAVGAPIREYVWLRNMPISVSDATGIFFIHVDHLNTPRLIANAAGTIVWRWDQQEAFGDNVADENPNGLGAFHFSLRLPGQYADSETGLNYNYFRDCYNPILGRYCESDPIGVRGGLNSYLYVDGDPLGLVDLDGLSPFDPLFGLAYQMTGGAEVPQGLLNSAAGFGSGVSFGLTNTFNQWAGTTNYANACSATYQYSKIAGNIVGALASGGVVLKGAAQLSRFSAFRFLNQNPLVRIGPGKPGPGQAKVPMLRFGPYPQNIQNSAGQYSPVKAWLTHWRL